MHSRPVRVSRTRPLRRAAGAALALALVLSLGGCYVVPAFPGPGYYGFHPGGWYHGDDDR